MPTANVNGQELHYLQRGEGEPLLLIQGLSGTHLTWGEEFLEILERDFALTVFDNRGVGKSSRVTEPFSVADMADDAAGLLDALGLERAHVLGISMGGMIAQHLTLRHPGKVTTLTLGCTYSGGAGSATTSEAVARRLTEGWSSGDREKAIRTAWEVNVSPSFAGGKEQFRTFRENALGARVALEVIMLQVQAVGGHDVLDRLGEIETPTLIIHGELDEMLPVANGRLIASKIPGARYEEFEDVGHLFWVEEPERSAALIRDHAQVAATG
jgi:3-oxoadipate enol-lactonase